jgi:hypothetical protein
VGSVGGSASSALRHTSDHEPVATSPDAVASWNALAVFVSSALATSAADPVPKADESFEDELSDQLHALTAGGSSSGASR